MPKNIERYEEMEKEKEEREYLITFRGDFYFNCLSYKFSNLQSGLPQAFREQDFSSYDCTWCWIIMSSL